MREPQGLAAQLAKACCAGFYENDLVRWFAGDSLHPGGPALTKRLAQVLDLGPGHHVLDLACGSGTSAVLLAREFGCRVTGVDYSSGNLQQAYASAKEQGLDGEVKFILGDVEALALSDKAYDAVICECALSTFPDKGAVLNHAYRVLRAGGRLGLSDVVVEGALPPELDGVAANVACIGQALSLQGYIDAIQNANFCYVTVENHTSVVRDLLRDLQRKTLLARMASAAGALALQGVDLAKVQRLLGLASKSVDEDTLGYSLFVARR